MLNSVGRRASVDLHARENRARKNPAAQREIIYRLYRRYDHQPIGSFLADDALLYSRSTFGKELSVSARLSARAMLVCA